MHPHPPMPPSPFPPYHHWYTDVEPAYEKPAECECHFPPMPDNCICVTEEDVYRWNSTYSAFSALIDSGIDVSAITSAAQVAVSAYLWNQTYTAVSSYSGLWNSVSAVSAKTDILADDLVDLSGKFTNHIGGTLEFAHHVDNETIIGNGTPADPWRLANSAFSAYEHNYDVILDQIKSLEDNVSNCEENVTQQLASLSGGHVQNFELIMQIIGRVPNSGNVPMVWSYEPGMRSNDYNSFTGKNTQNWIYFNTYNSEQ